MENCCVHERNVCTVSATLICEVTQLLCLVWHCTLPKNSHEWNCTVEQYHWWSLGKTHSAAMYRSEPVLSNFQTNLPIHTS